MTPTLITGTSNVYFRLWDEDPERKYKKKKKKAKQLALYKQNRDGKKPEK